MENNQTNKDIDVKHDEVAEIEVINGNGSEIDVSPVFEHLNVSKPKTKDESQKNKKIIIPKA